MRQRVSGIIILLAFACAAIKLHAQDDCTFTAPFLTIDFGAGKDIADLNFFPLSMYKRAFSSCPDDGFYAYAGYTSGCFNNDWLTFNEDHTPGDIDGRMMLVNASESGGIFFNFIINNLKGNTTYQLAAWLINVCRIKGGCAPLPPNIRIKIRSLAGIELGVFHTGQLSQNATPIWKRYEGIFTTPSDVNAVLLTMEDITLGGCGNDFAMDDVTLQECIKPTPVVVPVEKPVVKEEAKKEVVPPVKKEIKNVPPKKTSVLHPAKKDTIAVTKRQAPDKVENIPTPKKELPVVAIPKPILTRANPIIKTIETVAAELIINLYDNGEIDGDTVTIYHNNQLIVSRAGLSEKPISFHVKVDAAHPHHELVMVAENLGSIPPNTSLMVVTANNKRYEIFISSSEQKNAKIVIDLEK
jgi:hypothetical protein